MANAPSDRWSEPGTLRTANTSVVRGGPATAPRRAAATDAAPPSPGARSPRTGCGCRCPSGCRRRAPRARRSPATRADATAADPRSRALGDLLRGARGVVGRLDAPRPRAAGTRPPGRAPRRSSTRARSTSSVSPGQREQREPDRDRHLADDRQLERPQQVEVLADRAQQRALDGHDAGVRLAVADGLEHGPERRQGDGLGVREEPEDRVLRERAGLAGIGDPRAGRGRRWAPAAPFSG